MNRKPIVALTGGIGSGKSFVAERLLRRGIAVYDCDAAAKRLMRESAEIRRQLTALVGTNLYQGEVLQKRLLAEYLLRSEANKQRVNQVVHPAVADDFASSGQNWFESAILFESRFYKRLPIDFVVCVTAPEEVRLERICRRDGITREKALCWIKAQWPQDDMEAASDFALLNDGVADIDSQLDNIIHKIENT
mgnify:CR=1 FL=1